VFVFGMVGIWSPQFRYINELRITMLCWCMSEHFLQMSQQFLQALSADVAIWRAAIPLLAGS
jgi:hypothetical protein